MNQTINIETGAFGEVSLNELDSVSGGSNGSVHLGPVTITWTSTTTVIDLKGVGAVFLDKGGGGAWCVKDKCVPF